MKLWCGLDLDALYSLDHVLLSAVAILTATPAGDSADASGSLGYSEVGTSHPLLFPPWQDG